MFQTNVKKIKTHFMCSNLFPHDDVCEVIWKKYGTTKQATGYNIIWHMPCACWITKAIGTHSEYVE